MQDAQKIGHTASFVVNEQPAIPHNIPQPISRKPSFKVAAQTPIPHYLIQEQLPLLDELDEERLVEEQLFQQSPGPQPVPLAEFQPSEGTDVEDNHLDSRHSQTSFALMEPDIHESLSRQLQTSFAHTEPNIQESLQSQASFTRTESDIQESHGSTTPRQSHIWRPHTSYRPRNFMRTKETENEQASNASVLPSGTQTFPSYSVPSPTFSPKRSPVPVSHITSVYARLLIIHFLGAY